MVLIETQIFYVRSSFQKCINHTNW